MAPLANILKNAAPLTARVVPAAVHEAHWRGREVVGAAEAEARRILDEAGAQSARARAAAEEEGRGEGLARAAAILAEAAAERDRLLASLGGEVADLALRIARKVLGEELQARPDAVVELAARALEVARGRSSVTLRLHPADSAPVRRAGGRLGAILVRAPLVVREDPTVARGAVAVETEAGRIDAGIEVQLAALAAALEEVAA